MLNLSLSLSLSLSLCAPSAAPDGKPLNLLHQLPLRSCFYMRQLQLANHDTHFSLDTADPLTGIKQANKLLCPDSCNGQHSSYSFFPICDWVGNWPQSVIPSSSSSASSSSPLLSSYSPLQQQKANAQKPKQKQHNTHSSHTSLFPISSFERSCSIFFLIIILTHLLILLPLSLSLSLFPAKRLSFCWREFVLPEVWVFFQRTIDGWVWV